MSPPTPTNDPRLYEGTPPQVAAAILAEYRQQQNLYRAFAKSVEELVRQLLADVPIEVHSITSREKALDKLEEKLTRPGKHYQQLSQVTDLAGVRIITHFNEEVDAIGRLIDSEFRIDPINSIDKRALTNPDRFGYLSLHKVCWLSEGRIANSENRKYNGLECEIQIRTILQHAWAEIEHDLGYKSKDEIPKAVQRRFARLAALLEMADEEFARLNQERQEYSVAVEEHMKQHQTDFSLDMETLAAFLEQSETIIAIGIDAFPDGMMRPTAKEWLTPMQHRELLAHRLQQLRSVGIEDIKTLNTLLQQYRKAIVALPNAVRRANQVGTETSSGLPERFLYSLSQIIAALKPDKQAIQEMRDLLIPKKMQDNPIWEGYGESRVKLVRSLLNEERSA